VVFLHLPGKNKEEDFQKLADLWEDYCKDNHIILVFPKSDNEAGWIPSDAEFVVQTINETAARYTIDRQRIVTHGMGVGGQMAIYMGFNNRDLVRGVITTGAVVTNMKDNTAGQRLSFFLSGGELDPLIKNIRESHTKLVERRFPVLFREYAERGRDYFNEGALREVARWLDCLDRQ